MSSQFLFRQAPRLDSFYLQILWSTVRGSPVSRLHLSLEPLAAGCWSHHQYTKYKYNGNRESFCMCTERCHPKLSSRPGFTRRICLVLFWCRTRGWGAGAAAARADCSCSVYYLQMSLQCPVPAVCSVLAAGVARDCQPGRRGPSIRRDIICGADTLTSRGHTRATWPYT